MLRAWPGPLLPASALPPARGPALQSLTCFLQEPGEWPGCHSITCRQGFVRLMLTCGIKPGHPISLCLKGQSPSSLASTQDQQSARPRSGRSSPVFFSTSPHSVGWSSQCAPHRHCTFFLSLPEILIPSSPLLHFLRPSPTFRPCGRLSLSILGHLVSDSWAGTANRDEKMPEGPQARPCAQLPPGLSW